MGKIRVIVCVLLFISSHFGYTQELTVEGYFLQDSAMLGQKVGYVLKATYPSDMNVLFPDSTYQFDGMEYLGKEVFISYSQDSTTRDSAVYYLSNFSIDPVKAYRLPVFEVLKYDSIIHFPQESSLHLKLTINEMPEELVFKETNRYQPVKKDFNYPYLIIALTAVVLLILLLFFVFGKKVSRTWSVYQEKRRQKKFISQWVTTKNSFIENPSLDSADELLGLWKGRMESLTGRPFREWTATETAAYLEMPEVLQDFRNIELIIYANRPAKDVHETCEHLEKISTSTFYQKIKNLP